MQKVTPFLMFNDQAEEAAKLYTSVLQGSKVVSISRGPDGRATSVRFELEGQPFLAFNGGPTFTFSEGFSIFVSCGSQAEVDELWTRLTADGGAPGRCGWLKDRFGVSWQIIPTAMMRLMGDPDAARVGRVVKAMLGMGKIEIAGLERAYEGL